VGVRWKRRSQSSAANGNPLILWHLGEDNVCRFLELQRLIPGITCKMLTQRLREPERDGIVARKIFNEMPPHVECSLTKYASTLRPLLPGFAIGVRNMKRMRPETARDPPRK
jgi:DNA-binding HxlR family transcriptional regulator